VLKQLKKYRSEKFAPVFCFPLHLLMIIESKAPVRIDFAGAWTDVKYFAHSFGGATTNAAIDRYVAGRTVSGAHESPNGSVPEGISVTYETDIPAGSGLGTSSALNVVWLSLASGKTPQSREERGRIAEQAYEVETVLGILGGKQDQYAAAFGGFNLFEFEEDGVKAHPINIAPDHITQLEGLLTLCYTGQARLSSNLHENVWGGFRAGKRDVVESLFTLRDSAYRAKEILETGSFDQLAELLSLQHQCAKRLDASLSNDLVEGIFDLVSPHIRGGKCCGAGGGGCMVFLSETPEKQQQTAQALHEQNIRVIDFKFAMDGLTVTRRG
jgi:D-glycero-alpha-D-manno-heptose-7-phosphate kinase